MKKKLKKDYTDRKLITPIIFVIFFVICAISSYAQQGEWTWMNGGNTVNETGVYGTQGVFAAGNTPPAYYEACEWTDHNGNFWLFGGSDAAYNDYSDLWEFNPSINQWAWMKGPGGTVNQAGIYGMIGVSAPTNNPGARAWGVISWVDISGNLWLWGGLGYDSAGTTIGNLSDLWKYDIATNEWTWMKGPNVRLDPGTYGTQGMEAPANNPPSRQETSASWTDNNNNLWLFGGAKTVTTAGTTYYGDLWRYDITTNNWSWMKGSNAISPPAVYGTVGVPDTANEPGGRVAYGTWIDCNGDLWLFGGKSGPNVTFRWLNDLWRYQIAANTWTWMGGTNVSNDTGVAGTQCIPSTANRPSARFENRARWSPCCNHFENFGGIRGINGAYFYNDLWDYNVTTGEWTLMSGSTVPNQASNYGAITVSSPTNMPGCRSGSLGWRDNSGNLWLFGGLTTGGNHINDMWRFVPLQSNCASCPLTIPHADFISSDTVFCNESGKCISFYDQSTGNPMSWQWTFTGAIPSSSIQQNPDSICYYTPGTYPVTLVVSNSGGTDTLTVSSLIVLTSPPPPPIITSVGDTLYSSHASDYQWYFNGSPIAGATDSFYLCSQSGVYSVQITDGNGCNSLSSGYGGCITGINELTNNGITVYPNPASQSLVISHWSLGRDGFIEIYNVLGEKIYSSELQTSNSKLQTAVDVSGFANGIYFAHINTVNKQFIMKVIILH